MEKNIAKHVLADVLWVTHKAKGRKEAKSMHELLQRSYQSRKMDWHEDCLKLAWEQYGHWMNSGYTGKLPNDARRRGKPRKNEDTAPIPIRLEKRGRLDWEFAWPGEVLNLAQEFEFGIEYLAVGNLKKARQVFKNIIKECPYFIDALNHLAITEWDLGNLVKAEYSYIKAYEIGHSVLPANFKGILPWSWVNNRPFLRTLHGLSLVKLRQNDIEGTKELLRMLIQLDPEDNLGAQLIMEDIKNGTVPWED